MIVLYFRDILVLEKFKKVKNGAIEANAGFAKAGDIHYLFGQRVFQKLDIFFNKKILDGFNNGKII